MRNNRASASVFNLRHAKVIFVSSLFTFFLSLVYVSFRSFVRSKDIILINCLGIFTYLLYLYHLYYIRIHSVYFSEKHFMLFVVLFSILRVNCFWLLTFKDRLSHKNSLDWMTTNLYKFINNYQTALSFIL